MQGPSRLVIVGKQRPFDEERWKELLMAMAYLLLEQRKTHAANQHGSKAGIKTEP